MTEASPFEPTLASNPFFNPDLTPTGELASLVSEFWPLVQAHLPSSRKRPVGVEAAFASLVANLITALHAGYQAVVAPRNKRFLSGKSRYRPSFATYDAVTKALTAMVSSGLINQEIGSGQHKVARDFHDDLRCVRQATTIKPSDHLSQGLAPLMESPVWRMVSWSDHAEVIHLRTKTANGCSQQVGYTDTPDTMTFRHEVQRINQHLRDHPCHYAGEHRVNLMHNHVRRIFNNGDWEQGGRLYGYWPMNLPRGERHHLTIDGEPLADLDFGSCFVALLHVHDGAEFDLTAPDPFSVEGYENQRDAIKQSAYAILNAPRRMKNYPENITSEDGSKPTLRWRDMEQLIFASVPLFEEYRYQGLGLKLMRRESDILIRVLLDLTERGIGFVPMHDGLMVPESKARLTKELMLKHYEGITGQGIAVKDKTVRRPVQEPFVQRVGQPTSERLNAV